MHDEFILNLNAAPCFEEGILIIFFEFFDHKTKQINMKMTQTLAVLASLMAGAGIATAGSITGTVTLKGTPPKEAENSQIMSDPVCSKMHTTTPTTHHYVVGGKGELANVVVMLKGVPAKAADASKAPAVLDQKNCEYVPTILAVQTGQKITIKNSDP